MTRTYVIPDIHGRSDLLEGAIDAIVTHADGRPSTVVTLGDYVDRGPHACRVIDLLRSWKSPNLSIVNLMGNHEAMMVAVCRNQADLNWWIKNGGDATLASYGQSATRPDLRAVPPEHVHWLYSLPMLHIDRYRVFVHAAVDPEVPLDQQSEETLLWKRYPEGADVGHGARHVVHGHHANRLAPIVRTKKTNLDGMAWKTGRLIVGIFNDDEPGGASGFLEILREQGA